MRLGSLVDSLSTQARVLVLLLFAIVPFSALLVYAAMDRYQLLEAHAKEQTLHMALMAATNQNAVITQTRQLLEALANDQAIRQRDWAQCNRTLPGFFEHFKDSYSVFHVADATGKVVCSAKDLRTAVNIGDRKDFKDAVASRQFVAGDLNRSRTTGLMSIMMRYPVVAGDRSVFAVVTAQVSADQFDKASSYIKLPDDGELVMTDRNDKIVFRKPAADTWVGQHLPDGPLLRALHTRKEGIIETEGADGVRRIYGFTRVGDAEESGMHVAVGFPVAMIDGAIKSNLYWNVTILLTFIIVILSLAWLAVDTLVLRKVKILVDALDNVRDSSARTASPSGGNGETMDTSAIDEKAAEIERMLNLLREETIRDPLTSLYNRRYLAELLGRELMTARRKGGTLGVISADIDHFKRINDTFGHAVGDKVLVSVANTLAHNIRGGDVVCRVGGEEFTIVMPGASLEAARARAEGLREAVAHAAIEHNGKRIGTINISLGVSVFPDDGRDAESLLRQADNALYHAKRTGRNRVAVASELPIDTPLEGRKTHA